MWLQEIFNQVFDTASNRLKVLTHAPDLEDKIDDLNNKITALDAAIDAIKTAVEGTLTTQLSGSNPEQASAQDTQVATTVKTYAKPVGASQIEVYCETGYVRVRTDGEACTSTTGEPIAAGFGSGWQADSISVYFIQESVITVVSR